MDGVSQAVFIIAIVLIPVTTVAVALRIWDRFSRTQVPGWDDGLIIVSWIFSMILCATIAALMKYGLGAHRVDVPQQEYMMFLKFQMLTSVSYSVGMASAKASFAVLYLRLFPVRRLMILNKAVITFLLLQAIEESLIVIFKCKPIKRSWMPDLEGSCLDLHPLWYTTFAFNFSTDIVLFFQPILMTWKLRMPVIKRFTIGVMLSLGFFVTGIAVIRLTYVIPISSDDTHQLAKALIWSAAEVCSLIICSCIPSFRRVVLKIPYLGTALGLSVGHGSVTYVTSQGDPVQLQGRNRKEYIRSKNSKFDRTTNLFPSTTHTTATALGTTDDDSNRENYFPHRADLNGAIMVTREVIHSIKSREDSTPSKASNIT